MSTENQSNEKEMMIADQGCEDPDLIAREMLKAKTKMKEIEKELNSLRPIKKEWMTKEGYIPYKHLTKYDLEGILMSSGAGGALFTVMALSLSEPVVLMASGIFFASSIVSALQIAAVKYDHNSSKNQKFRRMCSKIFLTKRQREIQEQKSNEWQSYVLACEGYKVFIESKRREMADLGYINIINEHSEENMNGDNLTLNDDGKFEWVNTPHSEMQEDYILLTRNIMKKLEGASYPKQLR